MKQDGYISALLKHIATLGFVGYLPVAPGTWGTLAGLVFMLLVRPSDASLAIIISAVFILGIIAAGRAEKVIGEADSGHIIIDEFAGYLVSVFYLPHTYGILCAAFLLFRVFDILKPFPIRTLESSLDGGTGIMADDMAAGLATNVIIHIWIKIF